MRVRLARALDDSFLILDEPSNDLDREAREALLAFLRHRPGGTLLISHDRERLELCESTLELSAQGVARYDGGWTQYWQARKQGRSRLHDALTIAKHERDAVRIDMQQRAENRQRQQRHATANAARGGMPKLVLGARKRKAQAQTTSGRRALIAETKAQGKVQATHAALAAMKVDPVMYAGIEGQEMPAQKLVAKTASFNTRRGEWLYAADLDFCWRGNLRLALRGDNGSGKSTLLQALRGQRLDTRGSLTIGGLASAAR